MRQGTGIREQRSGLAWLAVVALVGCVAAFGQGLDLGGGKAAAGKQRVVLVSDSADVVAGKEQIVEVRFRVEDGYHVNSHQPKDEFLIPTELRLDAADGVKVVAEDYPAGKSFVLANTDGETLSVYQGEFRVAVRVVAAKGAKTLTGTLHYQACDSAACFPPRSLPVKVAVNAK